MYRDSVLFFTFLQCHLLCGVFFLSFILLLIPPFSDFSFLPTPRFLKLYSFFVAFSIFFFLYKTSFLSVLLLFYFFHCIYRNSFPVPFNFGYFQIQWLFVYNFFFPDSLDNLSVSLFTHSSLIWLYLFAISKWLYSLTYYWDFLIFYSFSFRRICFIFSQWFLNIFIFVSSIYLTLNMILHFHIYAFI